MRGDWARQNFSIEINEDRVGALRSICMRCGHAAAGARISRSVTLFVFSGGCESFARPGAGRSSVRSAPVGKRRCELVERGQQQNPIHVREPVDPAATDPKRHFRRQDHA